MSRQLNDKIKQIFREDMTATQIRDSIMLTDDAVQWVVQRGNPVCATDFIGYIFDISILYKYQMRKIGGAVDVFGGFRVFSLNEKKPIISQRKALKIYKKLIQVGFLKIDDSPFSEFDMGRNIPIEADERLNLVEQPVFISVPDGVLVGYENGIEFSNPTDVQEEMC